MHQAVTKPELQTFIADFRALLEHPEARNVALLLCDNDQSIAQTFVDSVDGLNIGAFAQIAGMNLETVRHWVEIGVIEPYSLNGKFKFLPPHLLELRSVQQWQDLGLTLEAIKLKKHNGTVFVSDQPISIGETTEPNAIIQMFAKDHPSAQKLGQNPGFHHYTQAEKEALGIETSQIKADYDAQIEQLEQKKLEIEIRLERAKTLRDALESSSKA